MTTFFNASYARELDANLPHRPTRSEELAETRQHIETGLLELEQQKNAFLLRLARLKLEEELEAKLVEEGKPLALALKALAEAHEKYDDAKERHWQAGDYDAIGTCHVGDELKQLRHEYEVAKDKWSVEDDRLCEMFVKEKKAIDKQFPKP